MSSGDCYENLLALNFVRGAEQMSLVDCYNERSGKELSIQVNL